MRKLYRKGEFISERSQIFNELINFNTFPYVITSELMEKYSSAANGAGSPLYFKTMDTKIALNCIRPSIRLSGGEFFTWPYIHDGKEIETSEWLSIQAWLINYIRKKLPEYDIFIIIKTANKTW